VKRQRIAIPPGLSVLDHPELLGASKDQVERVLPVLRELLARQKSKVADLLFGRASDLWIRMEMRSLENTIINDLEDPKLACDCLNLLYKALTAWVMRNPQDVPFPRLYTLPKYSLNPLPENLSRVFNTYDAWKKLLTEQLAQYKSRPARNADRDDRATPTLEIVIASAIIYGGIHDMRSLLGIVRGISTVVISTAISERRIHVGVWINRAGIRQFQAWHPDPLTATLLFRFDSQSASDLLVLSNGLNGGGVPDPILISRLCKQFNAWTKSACGTDNKKLYALGGLRNLLRVAQKVAYIELPVIVAAYASGAVRSQSLGFDVLRRISRREWEGSRQPALQEVERPDCPPITPKKSSRTLDLIGYLAPLREALSPDVRKEIWIKLESFRHNVLQSSLQRSMADFGLSILCVPTKDDRREPAAVRETILTVANALHDVMGEADPLSMRAADLDPLIKNAVENSKQQESSPAFARTIRAFILFNTFLTARGIEDNGRSSFLIPLGQKGHVDPNLVSFEEFQTILEEIRIRWPIAQPDSRQQLALVLVILGFRCGLRREEARKIKIDDVLLGGIPELLIRCSENRTLKSDNALRRAPLDIFLEPEELELIRQWWMRRTGTKYQPGTFLFGGEAEGLKVVPASIFDTINQIMRRVTGDPNITFHHLRHSFGTWGFLRLMHSVVRPVPALLFARSATRAWLKDGRTFRPERLYRHNRPTRKHAYLIARLMGHGSPATTLGSYIHCLDWLLASTLAQSKRMSPDGSTIEMASGLTGKTYQRWTKESDHWEVPLTFWRQRARVVDPGLITERDPALADPAALNLNEFELTWNFLMTAHKPGETAETAGAIWGIESHLANRILERVAILKNSVILWAAGRERSLSASSPATAQMASEGIPNMPCHDADRQVLAAWGPFMQTMYLDPSRKVALAVALSTYIHRVWASKGYVLFHDSGSDGEEARQFMAFIDTLPIPCCNAELISFDLSKRSRKRSAWRAALQISASRRITKMRPQNSRSEASKNWLAIRPKFKFDNQTLSLGPGQAGFRFALTMGFLRYGHL
jgi:integrase